MAMILDIPSRLSRHSVEFYLVTGIWLLIPHNLHLMSGVLGGLFNGMAGRLGKVVLSG